MTAGPPAGDGPTPFGDLDDFAAIPRVAALRLSPDGSWLAAAVQTLSPDRKKYLTSIWRIDTRGGAPRRLTRSAEGEASPCFLPDGSLLFTSERADPDTAPAATDGADSDGAALWLLPGGAGEARVVAALPGGVAAAEAARPPAAAASASSAAAVTLTSPVLPAADRADMGSAAADARLRKARADAGVTAILHESAPVRFWDHDLGPDQLRLFAVDPGRLTESAEPAADGDFAGLRDLTPQPGRALDDQAFGLTPDGASVVTGWWRWQPAGESHSELALVDVATGKRRVLLSLPGCDFRSPRVSPDGRSIVCQRETHATADRPADLTLVILDVDGPGAPGEPGRDLLAGLDRWPGDHAWSHDSRAVYFAADDGGRRPVFRVDVTAGEVTRVTGDGAAYTELNPAPDGRYLYALRSAVDSPPTPVRIDLDSGATPVPLPCPGAPLALPGRLEEVRAAADDGHPVRSWLVLPDAASAASPAPLLLWVHGGPMMSWNAWSWRWNPWLMAARGYAVLLPDPALSTGYGQEFIARGHREWGARPFADIMAATDAVLARPDIDAGRAAMMGGSYGGYMANWMAGHTDRFKAIVSHAGLWALDQMFGTTDHPMFWRRQFGDPLTSPQMYEANSPHRHVARIRTPVLVIHGNKDYRVPVTEALRLWWDLTRHGAEAKFLYFPDENHWILTPGNAQIWYETVFAFLAEHVLGQEWQRPPLLG
ncbi:MAG: S9 family peptidase [Streptosporangiaceae bacterium]|nr:S9 family peptidase [Streptosporangiaceae bacterium]